ncbi:hypothetical protein [Herbaspirillum huttiense]|uniref:hypothetical protein n=1 Tax=Herbaspirillum huttiense TaxID=863372 RepID=UPI003B3B4262
MGVQPALTNFKGQIKEVNRQRCAAGLPPLDCEQAVREAIQVWNSLLREAEERLRERAQREMGRGLAGNSFTHLVLAREIESEFRTAVAEMAESPR